MTLASAATMDGSPEPRGHRSVRNRVTQTRHACYVRKLPRGYFPTSPGPNDAPVADRLWGRSRRGLQDAPPHLPTGERAMTLSSTYRATSIALTLFAAAWAAPVAQADPLPVLMVIANQDFYYQEYASVRKALEARGVPVVVAAGTTADAVPQDKRGYQWLVHLDRPLSAVSAGDYSAIVFVG